MIKLKVNGTPVDFKTTIFNDGTSQVWQSEIANINVPHYFKITFLWENRESEIIHLLQLIDLIRFHNKEAFICLEMPYVPFSRQDKYFNDKETFALRTFAGLLNSKKLNVVTGFDVHSDWTEQLIYNFQSISPKEGFHSYVYNQYKPDITFFPDYGAAIRYGFNQYKDLYGEKTRNQLTGKIEDYQIVNVEQFILKNKKILIVDDLMDRGGTFVLAAKELMKHNPKSIALCVSHALFSGGKSEMENAGISEFFTTNSLMNNKDGYRVWE